MGDTAYRAYSFRNGLVVENETLPPDVQDATKWSDTLKLSACNNTKINNCRIFSGTENCSDAVRGDGYWWNKCKFVVMPFGKEFGALTIKGAINGFGIEDCEFVGVGHKYDIELGQFDNYWYPGRPPTRYGTIKNCTTSSGADLRIQCWDADVPLVLGTKVKITKIPKFIWFPYFLFRYIQIRITNKLGKTNIKTE